MAKIEGGLFSINARGSLGNIITYQGRKHFRHVHRKATPTDPQSTAQLRKRAIFAGLITAWQALSAAEKQAYTDLGPQYNNNPGYNIFLTIQLAKANFWAKFSWVTFGTDAKFGGP